jgi:hypothetical protein
VAVDGDGDVGAVVIWSLLLLLPADATALFFAYVP